MAAGAKSPMYGGMLSIPPQLLFISNDCRTILSSICAKSLRSRVAHTRAHAQPAQSGALNLALFASLSSATLFAAWAASVYLDTSFFFYFCGPRDNVIRVFPPRLIRAHSRAHALATKFALALDRGQFERFVATGTISDFSHLCRCRELLCEREYTI